jgi:hypothetical protein
METVQQWLGYLRREIEAPDLWSEYLLTARTAAEDSEADESQPFSKAEQDSIVVRIEAVRVYLIDQGVSGEKLDRANGQLDYLVEAVSRLSRRDWKNVALAVAWQIGLAAAFAPEQARTLFETIVGTARHLLGG